MTEETEIDFGSSYRERCFKNTQIPEIGISTVHTEHQSLICNIISFVNTDRVVLYRFAWLPKITKGLFRRREGYP